MTIRKLTLCIGLFLLAATLLPGCSKEPTASSPTQITQLSLVPAEITPAEPTTNDSSANASNPEAPKETPAGNSSPQDELRVIADQVLKDQYAITDLSCFKIDIDSYQKGTKVTYELYIHGYCTNGEFVVHFDTDNQFTSVSDYNCSKYLKYLPNATPEAVQAAVAQLQADPTVALRPDAPFDFSIDQEGYLCLGTEVIIPIDPPQTTEDGVPMGGCGFDHEHIFPSARVCHYE